MKNLDALLIENARLILENVGLQRALDLEIDRLDHIAKYVDADNYIDSISPILTAIDVKVSNAIENDNKAVPDDFDPGFLGTL